MSRYACCFSFFLSLLLASCLARFLAHIGHLHPKPKKFHGQKRDSSDERRRVGKIALLSRGFFYRYGIPGLEGSDPRKVVQKHPISSGPPPAFGRISRISDQPTLITKFCTRTGLAQDNNRISALFQCPASAKSPSADPK